LTFTPRFKARLIVSALSCLGGSKRGKRPMNCQGPPALSFLPSGTSCNCEAAAHQSYVVKNKINNEARSIYLREKEREK